MMNLLNQDVYLNKFHRVCSLEDTLHKLKTGLYDLGLKEEVIFKKDIDCLRSTSLYIPSLRIFSNGKGTNKLMAEVTAYAEIIERISAGLEPGADIEPYSQVSSHESEILQKFNNYKYIKGYKWTHQDSHKHAVKVEDLLKNEDFRKEDFEILKMESELLRHWIPGRNLTEEESIFVPPTFVRWISSTNGLSSGNTIKEATLHACYEIFERFALVSFLRDPLCKAPTINTSSIKNKIIQNSIKFFESNGVNITIKDLSFNGLFPVYAVIFTDRELSSDYLMYNTIKAGASFNSETAIIRCFTERLQGTDLVYEHNNRALRESFTSHYNNDLLPLFFKGVCPINLDMYIPGKIEDFTINNETDLNLCINKCINISKLMKTKLVVVDHTHPVLNFPTVRVIIPGMSDFIKWWDPKKITRDFIGKYNKEKEEYHKTLFKTINSFFSI